MTRPQHTQLSNLSRKHTSSIQSKVYVVPMKAPSLDAKKFISPVKPNQATAPNSSAVASPGYYVPGDGDVLQMHRVGADDHLKYKSLSSEGVANYNHRGHT
jgi:hypothetical protein